MPTHACEAPGCTYASKETWQLRQHARQHTGERPFACRAAGCTAAFASRNAQVKHELVHARPHVVCPEPGCGFIAANSGVLMRHTRKLGHASAKTRVQCPFANCGKLFASNLTLKNHKNGPAHAGEGGTPVCKTCGAAFATVPEYEVHVREHRVERLAGVAKARRESHAGGGREAGGANL